jgi:putative hydrolase of the HAD superfamily
MPGYHTRRMTPNAEQWPDWQAIDTVCLDLDGTLLDLAYDNYIWRDLVPQRYAAARGMSLEDAYRDLRPRFARREGTLEWYSVDFWSDELGVDIVALHHEARELVGWLPGVPVFLTRLRALGKRLLLMTNSHPKTLAVKHHYTRVLDHLHGAVSSHDVGAPKEHADFWTRVRAQFDFDPERTLFADDSPSVLRAAQRAGIRWIYAVRKPDSSAEARLHEDFLSVDAVPELIVNGGAAR